MKMKRFLLGLLSLGFVLVFSVSAMAVDVKFSGTFQATGLYLDKTSLTKNAATDRGSTAFYHQKLRVQTDFIVSPGLKLVTRFDAMDRVWGAARSVPGAYTAADASYSVATPAEQENIAFNQTYIEYVSPIGLFLVGYINDNPWGLSNGFGKSVANGHTSPGIGYILPIGSWVFGAFYYKEASASRTAVNSLSTSSDANWDRYDLYAVYRFKTGSAGILWNWDRLASARPLPGAAGGNLAQTMELMPYVEFKVGPVSVKGEFVYGWGTVNWEDGGIGPFGTGNVKYELINAYLGADVDFKSFYFGGQFAYLSGPGNDPTHVKGGWYGGGQDWNPCLIMFNNDLTHWIGGINGFGGTVNQNIPGGVGMTNAWFGQFNGGVRPIPKLDVMAAVSYAKADTAPTGYVDRSYGWEIDVTGTYKITNNLSYMLGVGYWFTGDYYKATGAANQLRDDYLLINKLTLVF